MSIHHKVGSQLVEFASHVKITTANQALTVNGTAFDIANSTAITNIKNSITSINTKINNITTNITNINNSITTINGRLTNLENSGNNGLVRVRDRTSLNTLVKYEPYNGYFKLATVIAIYGMPHSITNYKALIWTGNFNAILAIDSGEFIDYEVEPYNADGSYDSTNSLTLKKTFVVPRLKVHKYTYYPAGSGVVEPNYDKIYISAAETSHLRDFNILHYGTRLFILLKANNNVGISYGMGVLDPNRSNYRCGANASNSKRNPYPVENTEFGLTSMPSGGYTLYKVSDNLFNSLYLDYENT